MQMHFAFFYVLWTRITRYHFERKTVSVLQFECVQLTDDALHLHSIYNEMNNYGDTTDRWVRQLVWCLTFVTSSCKHNYLLKSMPKCQKTIFLNYTAKCVQKWTDFQVQGFLFNFLSSSSSHHIHMPSHTININICHSAVFFLWLLFCFLLWIAHAVIICLHHLSIHILSFHHRHHLIPIFLIYHFNS